MVFCGLCSGYYIMVNGIMNYINVESTSILNVHSPTNQSEKRTQRRHWKIVTIILFILLFLCMIISLSTRKAIFEGIYYMYLGIYMIYGSVIIVKVTLNLKWSLSKTIRRNSNPMAVPQRRSNNDLCGMNLIIIVFSLVIIVAGILIICICNNILQYMYV